MVKLGIFLGFGLIALLVEQFYPGALIVYVMVAGMSLLYGS